MSDELAERRKRITCPTCHTAVAGYMQTGNIVQHLTDATWGQGVFSISEQCPASRAVSQ